MRHERIRGKGLPEMERTLRSMLVVLMVAAMMMAVALGVGCAAQDEATETAAPETAAPEPVSVDPDAGADAGQAVVEGACAQCHDATRIYLLQTEMPDWAAVVSKMESAHGAVLTDEEKAAVTSFLEQRTATEAEQLISGKCTSCHDLSRIYLLQTEMPDWEAIVSRMTVQHGAALTAEEQAAIVEYLESR